MATYSNSRNIGWYRLKVVKRRCRAPYDEVDRYEEATKNNGKGAAYYRQ